MYQRLLNLSSFYKGDSFFLFGPRAIGKSTFIREQLVKKQKSIVYYDLLDLDIFSELLRNPKLIEEEFNQKKNPFIVIDEIQKLPNILNEVHRLITTKNMSFLLTGSSARKLRRGGVNLLGGRALESTMLPLTSKELAKDFDLLKYLHRGGLPKIYESDDWHTRLRSYINLYLREEIKEEALVRNIDGFIRFLDTVGLNNGEELSFENLSKDCGVPAKTVQNYINILEDTLIGYTLIPYRFTKKRKPITRSKLYLFDVGVAGVLAQRGKFLPKSEAFGKAFEHFIIGEIRAYLAYTKNYLPLQYWRSTSQFEVDVIVGNQLAIEIKASDHISDKHLKGLKALREEQLIENYMIVSTDKYLRTTDNNITVMPWDIFLEKLWGGDLIRNVYV